MSTRRSGWIAAMVTVVVVAFTSVSLAQVDTQPEPTSKQEAREAYALGAALAKQGQWHDAVAAFARAAALYPHAATSFNLGYCERALGNATRARKFFRLALAQHERTAHLSAQRVRQTRSYVSELDTKIARVRLAVSHGARITVDGTSLEWEAPHFVAGTLEETTGEVAVNTSMDVLIDPGAHVFVARADDGRRARVETNLAPGARTTLDLRFPISSIESRALSQWSLVTIAAGASGLLVGTVFGVVAIDKQAMLDSRCSTPSSCPPEHAGDIVALQRTARASTIALSVGGVVAALGVAMLLYDGFAAPLATGYESTVRLTPHGLELDF